VIVESPAKARTIGKYLGSGYTVKASMGHVRDLPKSTLGVDVDDDFAPTYLVPRDKTKLIKELKESVQKAREVYLATDPDREGEAIAGISSRRPVRQPNQSTGWSFTRSPRRP